MVARQKKRKDSDYGRKEDNRSYCGHKGRQGRQGREGRESAKQAGSRWSVAFGCDRMPALLRHQLRQPKRRTQLLVHLLELWPPVLVLAGTVISGGCETNGPLAGAVTGRSIASLKVAW